MFAVEYHVGAFDRSAPLQKVLMRMAGYIEAHHAQQKWEASLAGAKIK